MVALFGFFKEDRSGVKLVGVDMLGRRGASEKPTRKEQQNDGRTVQNRK